MQYRTATITGILVGILAISICSPLVVINAYAHGSPPGSCGNEYDYTVKSFKITSYGQTYDPIANPGLTFDGSLRYGYDVTFVIHSAKTSRDGNSNAGSAWYENTALGFGNGVCIQNVNPDQDKTVTVSIVRGQCGGQDGQVAYAEWNFEYFTYKVTYNVKWHSDARTANLTLDPVGKVPWGKDITISGKLTDAETGHGVGGIQIVFWGNGVANIGNYPTTNADGTFSTTATAPSTVGSGWNVSAESSCDSTYTESSTSITYNTIKHKTSLTLYLYPDPVAPSGTYKVHSALKDSVTSTPLPGKTITFTATPPVTIPSKATDSSGVYRATGLVAPSSPGSYNIQAHFAGDSLYSARDSKVSVLTVS